MVEYVFRVILLCFFASICAVGVIAATAEIILWISAGHINEEEESK